MIMAVMQIRIMPMRMGHRRVAVPVRVRFLGGIERAVFVPMMGIV